MEFDSSSTMLVAYQAVRNSIIKGIMDVNEVLSLKFCDAPILQLAILLDDNQFIDYLLSHGVNIDQPSNLWGTALHQAVKMQKIKVVKKLVKSGANVNACHLWNSNFTPLHIAVENNCYKIAKILANHGADVEILSEKKNDFGDTPLQIALRSKDEKMINMLLKNVKMSTGKLTYRTLKALLKDF